MKCDFVKFSPTQNMTVIVTSPVARDDQRAVAEKLMAYDGLYAEQVGFIEEPSVPGAQLRLQMMGGEFCGNAAMCAAVIAACKSQDENVSIEISGADGIVHVRTERDSDTEWRCCVRMPLPTDICEKDGLYFVRMPGITHAVMFTDDYSGLDGERILRDIAKTEDADALGLIMYSRDSSVIKPLVYVRGTDTMVWERGCGSGTAAIGAVEAYISCEKIRREISQPGGVIAVEAQWQHGKVCELSIEGKVKIVAEGSAFV